MLIDILMLVIIAITVMTYFKNGFVVSLFNTASTVISIILIAIFHNPVTDFIKQSAFGKFLYSTVHDRVNEMFAAGSESEMPQFVQEFIDNGINSANEAAIELSDKVLGVAVGIVAFVLIVAVLKLVAKMFPKLLRTLVNIPVIKQCDKLLGGILGAVVGVIWVIVAIYGVGLLSLVPALEFLDEQLADSLILATLQNMYIGDFLF